MEKITSLTQFTDLLDQTSPEAYPKLIKRLALLASDLQDLSHWEKQPYSRNCLARTENYEVVLLCWHPGAKTPIHGHDGQRCWVYQLEGQVAETRYEQGSGGDLIVSNQMVLMPGRKTYIQDKMGFHTLENIGTGKAMTLHIYVNPIDVCEVYDEEKGRFSEKLLSYDTIKTAIEV